MWLYFKRNARQLYMYNILHNMWFRNTYYKWVNNSSLIYFWIIFQMKRESKVKGSLEYFKCKFGGLSNLQLKLILMCSRNVLWSRFTFLEYEAESILMKSLENIGQSHRSMVTYSFPNLILKTDRRFLKKYFRASN